MNMNDNLRGKYTTDRPIQGFPAKARTGNSHGPTRDKVPAKVPCKRAPCGKTFTPDKHVHRAMVMRVNGLTGHARMEPAS